MSDREGSAINKGRPGLLTSEGGHTSGRAHRRAHVGIVLAIALLALGPARAWANVTLQKMAMTPNAYVGGTLVYNLSVMRTALETGVVVYDPTPAGHQLLRAQTPYATLDCSQPNRGNLGLEYPTVVCDATMLEVHLDTGTSNPPPIAVTYRVPPTPGTSTNVATVTCTNGCMPTSATATAMVVAPAFGIGIKGPGSVAPGDPIVYVVTATNGGTLPSGDYAIDDPLPASVELVDVVVGGARFSKDDLATPRTAPDGAQVTLANGGLHIQATGLGAGAGYTVTIDTRAPKVDRALVANAASVTPAGGSAVRSTTVETAVVAQGPPLALQKRVTPEHARIGASVTYTLTLTPNRAQAQVGPITLSDAFDAALAPAAVTVGGVRARCGPTATPVGDFILDCGSDGRHLTLAVPAGIQLAAPLTVEVNAVVLASAAPTIANSATVSDRSGLSSTAAAALAVDDAGTKGASLSLGSGRVEAQKNDLVPFVALVGVPGSGHALTAATLALTPSSALRMSDVRVTGPDGVSRAVTPSESGGALVVPLPALAPGATATVLARARVTGRASPGTRATLQAGLAENGAALASANAGVRVIADADFDLGTVLGEVFRDDNGNGVRDRGEPGLGGALVALDDGLQAITDGDGRYHLAAVVPGDRAIKVAAHTLPPGARLTTDVTRIINVTPGSLVKVDFGVRLPAAPPPAPVAAAVAPGPAELHLGSDGRLRYRLRGATVPGARVAVDGKAAAVDRHGQWSAEVALGHGRTRVALVTELPDGEVRFGARDVYWIERPSGGHLVVPRAEETRLSLRFPAGALADPSFTLNGSASAPIAKLTVAGAAVTPDAAGRVTVKLRLPEAGAAVAVAVEFADGLKARCEHLLAGGGDFVLLVGLAEGKLGYVQKDQGGKASSGFYAQGRVKLYAKGRILGRWLLEGGLDIDTSQLDSWRDLFRGDPTRVFRNLDPDRFYTVYGDASQATQAAQSRARLYVRIRVDRSELVLGNLQTGLTGVEMGRYSRAVTGGRLEFVRAAERPEAPPSTQVILFGAWLQTNRAHDELRGTGGSLYYLSHRNIVEGSEQVRIEIRDQLSERPLANTAQRATVDYEVDYLAGRILLRDPVASVATAAPTLVRSGNLDGDRAYVVVDYEYVVDGDSDDASAGARATQRLGPVRLGATFVNEFRSGADYTLLGGDVQIDLGKHGVILAEYARSYGTLSSFARSDDGGLSYHDAAGAPAAPSARQGNAYKAEADLHFGPVMLKPYFRGVDQGYTDTAHAQDAGFMQWGGEAALTLWKATLRLHYDERRFQQALYDSGGLPVYDANGNPAQVDQTRRDAGGELGRRFGRVEVRLGARTERADDADPTRAGHRTTVAARVEVEVTRKLSLYGLGQWAVEHGGGDGLLARDNSLGALGAKVELPWSTRATAEASYGAQGVGGLLSLHSDLGNGRALYGTVTLSQDRDDRIASTVAAGGRERISDGHGNARATLYAEDQFRDGPQTLPGGAIGDSGRAHMQTAGLDLPLSKRFVLGATFERGQVTPSGTPLSPDTSQPLDRTAGTLYASYAGDALRAQLKGELRSDTLLRDGARANEVEWLVSGMVTWRPHRDFTLRGKLLLSHASDAAASLARSNEATIGFAWRPSFTNRLALIGRYTWLDEGVPAAQGQNGPLAPGGTPLAFRERAHVASLAGEGRLFWRLSLGEKLAMKRREEVLPDGQSASWMVLWVNRLSLHVTRAWDAVVEYRLLYGPGPALTHGVAVEVNRIIVGHLRLGAGWNFADFSDDEVRLGRGSEKGFFIRAQGFY